MAAGRLLPLLFLLAAAVGARPGPNGEGSPPEICWLPMAVGPCKASPRRWWFNATSGSCRRFSFGGCDGNANSFLLERECWRSCVLGGVLKKHEKHTKQTDVDPAFAEHCTVPAVTGPCRASFLHWYYSPENGTCRQFIYGGCRGNKNNYPSREECLTRCAPKTEDSAGAGFRGDFGSATAPVLGLLLAVVAAVALAYVTFVAFKICRKKLNFLGTGRGPGENKERLMSHAYSA